MTGFASFNRRNYGKKDGESPTAGKKASRYRVVLPDMRTVTKSSFKVHVDNPVVSCYLHEGKWYVNAVFPADKIEVWAQPNEEGTRIVIKAERLP